MADRPVVVANNSSVVPVILSLIAAALIAFTLWFFVFDSEDQPDNVVPDVTVTSLGS